MARRKKLYKALKIVGLVLLVIALAAGVLVGVDYLNFKSGNRSILFGTIDNYNRGQTLKFDNFDLKVNSVVLKKYPMPPSPAQTNCDVYSSFDANGKFNLNLSMIKYNCQSQLGYYQDEVSHSKTKNELIVEFQYSTITDKPTNLLDYKVKLIANTALDDYANPSKKCTGIAPNHAFLRGYTEKECLAKDIDKGYSGPLALSVVKNGKEKIISLSVPSSPK